MNDRWKLGDAILWLVTGNEQDAKIDADVYLNFYNHDDEPIAWVKVFERGDSGGFEEGETNCGFLGNINHQSWLQRLFDDGTRLEVRVEPGEADASDWYLASVSLDFRFGPVVDVSTARTWNVNEWIEPGVAKGRFEVDGDPSKGVSLFEDVGFDKELEVEAGPAEPGAAERG